METSLFCSAPSNTAAASSSSKQGSKRPNNERRRLRINARNSSKPGMGTTAPRAAAPGEEAVLSWAAVATEAAAATPPPQAWAGHVSHETDWWWSPEGSWSHRKLSVNRKLSEVLRRRELLQFEGEEEVAPLTETADFSEKPTSSPTFF